MWKRRIGWLVLALAALGMYLFGNNTGTRLVLAVVLVLPILSGLSLFLFDPKSVFRWEAPLSLERNQDVPCTLWVTNPGLPLSGRLEISNLLTGETFAVPLELPHTKGEAPFPVSLALAHCGMADIQVKGLAAQGLFGLFSRKVSGPEALRITVEPVVTPLTVRVDEFWRDSDRYSTIRAGSDPSETFRIREYVPGDSVRQIHWKLSEKVDKSLIRDFGLPLGEQVLLTLEEAPATPDEVDAALDLLFSVGKALLDMDRPATVRWPAGGEYGSVTLYDAAGWELFKNQLFSAPLEPVTLRVEGMTIL